MQNPVAQPIARSGKRICGAFEMVKIEKVTTFLHLTTQTQILNIEMQETHQEKISHTKQKAES